MKDTLDQLQEALQKAYDALWKAPPDLALARQWTELSLALAQKHGRELRKRGINGAGSEGFGRL